MRCGGNGDGAECADSRGALTAGVCSARDGVPDLSPRDGPAGRSQTDVLQALSPIGAVTQALKPTFDFARVHSDNTCRHAPFASLSLATGNFEWCHRSPRSEPGATLSPRPPTAHRPRQFRGPGCHAPCRTPRAPAPAAQIRVQPASGWHPTHCPASDSTGSR